MSSKWIPVGDKWPAEEGQYIIATTIGSMTPKRTVRAGMFKSRGYPRFMTSDWEVATHWMPLPSHPLLEKVKP